MVLITQNSMTSATIQVSNNKKIKKKFYRNIIPDVHSNVANKYHAHLAYLIKRKNKFPRILTNMFRLQKKLNILTRQKIR